MARHSTSSSALDASERSWWSAHGEIEERFCWVQRPQEQRVVRGRYLDLMVSQTAPGSRVLEIGCGTGWLSLLLAERGLSGIVATDFSDAQLARARRAAEERGLADRVTFEAELPAQPASEDRFDVVIMHAFLHHLSTDEIGRALQEAADRLRPGGRLLLLEPIHFADGPSRDPSELRVLRRLATLPIALSYRRLRRQGPEETEVRARMAARPEGLAPFGPSPKEIPFAPDELRRALAGSFAVDRELPALCYAHLVAQELLIASLSQPRLWALVEPGLLRLAGLLDRRLLARPAPPSTVWMFVLTICTRLP